MDEFRIQAIGFASRDPVATKKAIETLRSQPQEHTHEMIRRMDSTAPHRAAMDKYLQASLDTQPEVIKSLEGYFRTTFQDMTQRVHVDKEDPKMVFQDMMQKAMADQENTKKQATVVASDLLSGELSGLWNEYEQPLSLAVSALSAAPSTSLACRMLHVASDAACSCWTTRSSASSPRQLAACRMSHVACRPLSRLYRFVLRAFVCVCVVCLLFEPGT